MQVNPLLLPTVAGAAAFFCIGAKLETHLISRISRLYLWIFSTILAVPGILFIAYYSHLFDNAAWYYNLRTFYYTELAGCGLGLIAGVVHSWWRPEGLGERISVPVVLLVLVLIPFSKPLINPLDFAQLKDRFDGDVCLQSTFSTCGPASAVTILRSFGENETEKKFAQECFTSRGGTEIWYLARALRHRGFATKVQIVAPEATTLPSPAIAGVVLPGGAGHFIAVMKATPQSVTIADPLKGSVVLARSEVNKQYRFTGFFLLIQPSRAPR